MMQDVHMEELWVIAIKNDEHDAFELVYTNYKRVVYYNLLKLVHLQHVAEELMQETFLRFWRHRSGLDPKKSLKAYLQRIATNLAIDFYRRAHADKNILEQLSYAASVSYNPIETELQHSDSRTIINNAMEKLSPKRREIFRFCKLEGKSYAEAAKTFGISSGTVNDHVVKATKFIREEILRNHPDICFILAIVLTS